jgi:Spy/CpxP family protein refolding chaperone
LEFIAKDIGKELIPFLSAEDIVRRLTPEDLVRVLTPEERKKLKQLLEEEDEKNQR